MMKTELANIRIRLLIAKRDDGYNSNSHDENIMHFNPIGSSGALMGAYFAKHDFQWAGDEHVKEEIRSEDNYYIKGTETRPRRRFSVDRNKIIDDQPIKSTENLKGGPMDLAQMDVSAMRAFACRYSRRAPEGIIHRKTIDCDDLDIVFINPLQNEACGDTSDMETCEDPMEQYRELEDLFQQAMGSLALDPMQSLNDFPLYLCKSAPPLEAHERRDLLFEGVITTHPLAQRIRYTIDNYNIKNVQDRRHHSGDSTATHRPNMSDVRLTPRAPGTVTVNVDEYIQSRSKAMTETPSSKLDQHTFNYAGYIPPEPINAEQSSTSMDVGTVSDFYTYLLGQHTDHLAELLFPEIDEEESMQRKQEELRMAALASEKAKLENDEKERSEKRRAMFEFKKGNWNAGILDYMALLHDGDESLENEKVRRAQHLQIQEEREFAMSSSLLPASDACNPNLPKTIVLRKECQARLESIWQMLRFPKAMRVEMAAKYGNHTFAPRLAMVNSNSVQYIV